MKMKKSEVMVLLKQWLAQYKRLEKLTDNIAELFGNQADSEYLDVVYRLFDEYTEVLALAMECDSHWMHWYIYDNKCGENNFVASSSPAYKPRGIKTLSNLADLIIKSNT